MRNFDLLSREIERKADCFYIITQREKNGLDFELVYTEEREYVLIDSISGTSLLATDEFNDAVKLTAKYLDSLKLNIEEVVNIG